MIIQYTYLDCLKIEKFHKINSLRSAERQALKPWPVATFVELRRHQALADWRRIYNVIVPLAAGLGKRY